MNKNQYPQRSQSSPSVARLSLRPVLLGTLFSFLLPLALPAQETDPEEAAPAANPPEKEEVIVLSPFEVSAESDDPWRVSETLAGTRLNSKIVDLAIQIQTFTKEFTEAAAVTNPAELYLYSTSVDGTWNTVYKDGSAGSISPADDSRIRGLAQATKSTDYFETRTALDTYNTTQTEIASGPNAILFGMGSAAGTLNTTLSRANVSENGGSVSARFDNEGGWRATLDYNQVLLKDKLGVRVAALAKDDPGVEKPAYDKDKRLFLTATARPFVKTNIRFSYENARRESSRGDLRPSFSNVKTWWDAGSPLFDNSLAARGLDDTDPSNNRSIATLIKEHPQSAIFKPLRVAGPVLVYGAPGVTVSPVDYWKDQAVRIINGREANPGLNSFERNDNLDPSLDPILFGNVWGLQGENDIQIDTYRGTIEQNILPGLDISLGYNREEALQRRTNYFRFDDIVMPDPNMYLPDGVTPNPNVGGYYLESDGQGYEERYLSDEFRGILAYQLDLRDQNGMLKWFGTHNFSLMYDKNKTDEGNTKKTAPMVLGDVQYSNGYVTKGKYRDNTRYAYVRYYYDDPTNPQPGADWGPGYLPGTNSGLGGVSGSAVDGTPVYFPMQEEFGETWARVNPQRTKQELVSKLGVWQGIFLKDSVVLFYGYRKEEFSEQIGNTETASSAARDPVTDAYSGWRTVVMDPSVATDGGHSVNKGIVFHPTKLMREGRMGPFDRLTLSYSEAENFNVPKNRLDAYNNPLDGAHGKSKEVALGFSMLDDKLAFKVNYYDNKFVNADGGNKLLQVLPVIEGRIRSNDPANSPIDPSVPTNGYDVNNQWIGSQYLYNQVKDSTAEGLDIELVYQYNRNWNMRLTAGKTETTDTDASAIFRQWIDERLPVWETVKDQRQTLPDPSDPEGIATIPNPTYGKGWDVVPISETSSETMKEYYENTIFPRISLIEADEGISKPSLPKWRAAFFTRYSFLEGRLKGLDLGGGARYRSSASIGYGETLIEGTPSYDKNVVYYGKSDFVIDLMAGYNIQLSDNLRWRIQLNVRNLLQGDRDLLPIAADTGGTVRVWGIEHPRQFVLTNTLYF